MAYKISKRLQAIIYWRGFNLQNLTIHKIKKYD